jgi:hypothetical protein
MPVSVNKGSYTLFGVFEEARDRINERIAELPKGKTNIKSISYRTFASIIRTYLKMVFYQVIHKGWGIDLYNKFGRIRVVKTQCIRYNPVKHYWVTENGKKVRKEQKLDVNKTGGYFHFIFWDCPKRLRHYKFFSAKCQKRKYYELAMNGFEYPNHSLREYGRNASTSYIQHIK